MFNQIGQPRFNSPLIRFFGMKIGGAAAPCLAPEIAPSFDVNQQDDPQLPFLRGEKLFSALLQPAAVVGEYSRMRLRNPATSGVLLRIDSLWVSCTNSVAYGFDGSASDEDTVTSVNLRDTRWAGARISSVASRGNDASAGSANVWGVIGGNDNSERRLNAIIAPGASLFVYVTLINIACTLTITGSERAIPAEELATG